MASPVIQFKRGVLADLPGLRGLVNQDSPPIVMNYMLVLTLRLIIINL